MRSEATARRLAEREKREKDRARREKDKARIDEKVEKLRRMTTDRGATPSESENARDRATVLQAKSAELQYAPCTPPLPKTAEELLARRKGPKARSRAAVKPDIDEAARAPLRAALGAMPGSGSRSASAPPADEIASLKAEIARLSAEVARLQRTRSRAGRKPIGDRPMTAAERMRRMRSRQTQP